MRTLITAHIFGVIAAVVVLTVGVVSPHHIFIFTGVTLLLAHLLLTRNTLRMLLDLYWTNDHEFFVSPVKWGRPSP